MSLAGEGDPACRSSGGEFRQTDAFPAGHDMIAAEGAGLAIDARMRGGEIEDGIGQRRRIRAWRGDYHHRAGAAPRTRIVRNKIRVRMPETDAANRRSEPPSCHLPIDRSRDLV